MSYSSMSVITNTKDEWDVRGMFKEMGQTAFQIFPVYFCYAVLFFFSIHTFISVPVHSELVEPLRLMLPLDQAFYSKAAPVSVAFVMVYNSIAAQLREPSHGTPERKHHCIASLKSCCILVLNSRQMCSCTHSVTWGQLYCIILRCTRERTSG